MSRVEITDAARRDLDERVFWLRQEAGFEVAERFSAAFLASFDQLAAFPGIGSPLASERRTLAKLRRWHVRGFPNLLIFYTPIKDGVRILRVTHGAQDWRNFLAVI